MGNSKPYFVWTKNGERSVNIAKAEELYWKHVPSEGEIIDDKDTWEVRAQMARSVSRTEDYLLDVKTSEKDAKKCIKRLMIQLNSGMRDTDGSPLITEVVSPEMFKVLCQRVDALQTIAELREERLDNLEREEQNLRTSLEEVCSEDSRQLVDKEQFNNVLESVMDVLEYLLKPEDDGGEENMVKGGKREANTAWRVGSDFLKSIKKG